MKSWKKKDGQWLIWTPDNTGGVIGSGDTEQSAIANAVKNLEETAELLMGMRSNAAGELRPPGQKP